MAITQGAILHSAFTVGKEYMVRFKLLPTGFAGVEWTSVIHFTTGANQHAHGARIPAVFIREINSARGLYVAAQATYGENFDFTKPDIPTNEWTDIFIQQAERAGRYVIEVIVNGEIIVSMVNYDPYVFANVKVYVSDPWYSAQPGFIKDFTFK